MRSSWKKLKKEQLPRLFGKFPARVPITTLVIMRLLGLVIYLAVCLFVCLFLFFIYDLFIYLHVSLHKKTLYGFKQETVYLVLGLA